MNCKGLARTMENVSAGKIGKYEIIKVLGRGGMGEVLLAQDEDLGRLVAIKRPFKSAAEDGLARFSVEAKAATLRHPNIPTVYEMGVQDGLPFIAMEFVEGEPLDKIISSGKQLTLIAKLRIIEQVSLALGYAHENGIIHRDIKPANVIVQKDGTAKIIDFGIAKVQDADGKAGLTQTSQVIGSLHYIAPERFKGGVIDGRVDIFSAGVTLFKLLTGQEPFTGGEATASYKIVNEAHTALSEYLHEYPPVLDEIVAKSLAKNPEERYRTGEDFADALHDVIEDLKRSRVTELFDDAERLTMESRYTPALELLEEAAKLDPANTQVRKLRKLVREHHDRMRRAERLRECTSRADEALLSGNYEEALTQLKEAQNLDTTSTDIRQRIQSVEEKKRRSEMSARALADAEAARNRGDITAAMRIVDKALQDDQENPKLLAVKEGLTRQAAIEAQRGRLLEILDGVRRELVARNLPAADKLLVEAEGIDPSNPDTDMLRREYAKAREQEQRREILEEIETRVNGFLRTGSFDQAAELLNRAIEKLPNETMLHRLKAEVDTEARKFESRRLVDDSISQAKELFSSSPFEALGILQKALDKMPGDERLLSYEQSLRKQLDAQRVEQVQADTLLKVRELMAGKQYDKAISVLESFQIEFGQDAEIAGLLAFARDEQAATQRGDTIERCASEGRALIRDGRLDEAIRLLDQGIQQTGDASLSRLLAEAKEQQVAIARKIEVLEQRVGHLRERGELGEALRLLQEQLATAPGNPSLQELQRSLLAEQQQKQATAQAIAASREAAGERDFPAGIEALQAVLHAYGESAELTRAIREIEAERSTYAQEVVGQSIESARAALLKNDPKAALAALKSATPMMEFADAGKQADWQRIGQSVKKAIEQSTTGSHGTAFDAQLSEIAAAKPKKFPVAMVAAAGAVLLIVVALVIWKLQPAPTPNIAHIKIAKAPPGAMVSIDNQPAVAADANGELSMQVKPGLHQLHVTMDGFEPFDDRAQVDPGGTYQDAVSMTKAPVAGTSGTLAPQGNLPEFKLSVDGRNMGLHRAGQAIELSIGTHQVKYTSTTNDNASQEHSIQIALNQTTKDSFFLNPAPSTTPSTNNQASGQKTSATTGVTTPPPQPPAPSVPPPAVPPTGSLKASTNSIEKGGSVQLSWDVSNSSSISISNYGDGLGPHGNAPAYPAATTTYELIANGTSLGKQTVTVSEPKAQTPAFTPPVVVRPDTKPAAPAGPDTSTLVAALGAYKSAFANASGKNKKDCQSALSGPFGGKLKGWETWCDEAKSFDLSEQSCSAGGSPEAPTLNCAETLTIRLKDGDPQKSSSQKTFRFAKGSDGNWQISSF